MQDLSDAAKAYQQFLIAIGVDENAGIDVAESAQNTAILMAEWMRGLHEERPVLSLMPAISHDLVSLRDIPFYSFCGHHFVPFFGTIQIDYYPDQHIAGLGGFKRVIEHYARRPQFQENLCAQIADHLYEDLQPVSLKVRLLARQMCVELSEDSHQIQVESTAVRGDFI